MRKSTKSTLLLSRKLKVSDKLFQTLSTSSSADSLPAVLIHCRPSDHVQLFPAAPILSQHRPTFVSKLSWTVTPVTAFQKNKVNHCQIKIFKIDCVSIFDTCFSLICLQTF